MGIDQYLKVIKEGVFGRDVRQAIHDGIERVYEDATFDGNTNMEVAKARGTNSTLSERLQNMDGTVASYAKEVETTGKRLDEIVANAGNGSVPSELIDMRTGADGRVHSTAGAAMREQFKSALTGERQIASPSDLVPPYNDLNTLKPNTILTYAHYGEVANKPDPSYSGGATVQTMNYTAGTNLGATQILTQSNGVMYNRIYWRTNGTNKWSEWFKVSRDGQVMTGDKQITTASDLVPPYNDLNTLKPNTILTYAHYGEVANKPDPSYSGGATVQTMNYTAGTNLGATQILTQSNGVMYNRIYWRIAGSNKWTPWQKSLSEKDFPKNIDTDPFQPSISLFEKIGVIGDSYSSGEIYPEGIGIDKYNLSWGQILARKNGVTCANFSKGGLTTRSWLTDEMGLSKLKNSEPQNLYYISLGINDNIKLGLSYLGTEADIDSGSDTFYGNYSKIIRTIQSKAPYSKIILIDSAWTNSDTDPFFVAIKTIASRFNLPLIKHRDDPFLASSKFKQELMVQGHPVAISYAGMASSFERLTLKAIRENISYFKDYRG
ncbi:TPA: SGNH/GDSL hydrolase family protein [Streptococcus pneumoniae]|nr:SGNH/GDSL hydrolase family protein [Streptococcus pneumoniae]